MNVRLTSLLAEIGQGVAGSPLRAFVTSVGIAVGIAAIVATVGVAESTGAQVAIRFTEQQPNYVVLRSAEGTSPIRGVQIADLDAYSVVESVGVIAVSPGNATVAARTNDPETSIVVTAPIATLMPESFQHVGASFHQGRSFDEGHLGRSARVAVLGNNLASRLGVYTLAGGPYVRVDERQYAVIGILDDPGNVPELDDAVVIAGDPLTAGPSNSIVIVINADRSAIYAIALAAPAILDPLHPEDLVPALPPPPPDVASTIRADINALAILLAAAGVVAAAISVSAVMIIGVLQRSSEIGLRRALGASRFEIAIQFLGESILIGLIGGVLGAGLGVAFVDVAAAIRGTPAVLSPQILAIAILVGAGVGIVSGVAPAMRAGRLAPAASLA